MEGVISIFEFKSDVVEGRTKCIDGKKERGTMVSW
jgi:hypothetical protein